MCLLHASAPYFILRPHCRHHRHRVTFEREPDLALPLTSHTVVAPDLGPKAAWSVNNVPASATLCWGGCLYLAPVWAVKPTLLLRTTVYLFFLFLLSCLRFPTSNSFCPGLPSDRQHNLSTAALSDRLHPFHCHTYTHADLLRPDKSPGSGSITSTLRRLCRLRSRSTATD